MPNPLQIFREMKKNGQPLAMITAYDAPTATICCDNGIDAILVGDSVGDNVLGYDSTVRVTIDDMVHHTGAVVRGVASSTRPTVPVIADLPIGGGLHESTFDWALRLLRAGASAVKMEVRSYEAVASIERLTDAGIPVMAHIGYTPQSSLVYENIVQGRCEEDADFLLNLASVLQDAGCFSVLMEAVVMVVAQKITDSLSVPTVGIGCGPTCDGQVLVWHDATGINEKTFRLAKKFAEARSAFAQAAAEYAREVHESTFPTQDNGWN